jgi:hypothetical protein
VLDALDLVHGISELQARRGKGRGVSLWPWSRMTGWRAVHAVMAVAGLDGPQASPKGLRHGFGVAAVSAGVLSASCRNGSGTPSSPPPLSTQMPQVLRRRTSPEGCGMRVADRLVFRCLSTYIEIHVSFNPLEPHCLAKHR